MFDRPLGIRRNVVVLPAGYQLTDCNVPSQVLAGAVDVIFNGTTPATPAANSPLLYAFRLRSRANLAASFAIQPVITVAANLSDWQSRVQVLDQNQNLMANNQISVAAGQEVPFFVQINPVPPGTNGTQFSLTVTASAGGVTGSPGLLTNTVGQAGEQPDNNITLNFSSAEVLIGTGTITASQIQMVQGARANVALAATFTTVGQYSIHELKPGGDQLAAHSHRSSAGE